jgi:hypothetical protein
MLGKRGVSKSQLRLSELKEVKGKISEITHQKDE